jgi:hypothetical protein
MIGPPWGLKTASRPGKVHQETHLVRRDADERRRELGEARHMRAVEHLAEDKILNTLQVGAWVDEHPAGLLMHEETR